MDEIRTVYNAFLPLFPYCYAYWKRYSDLERKKENWQRSLQILHRGLEAIPLSVDLWLAYLELFHKMYSTHDNFQVRIQKYFSFLFQTLFFIGLFRILCLSTIAMFLSLNQLASLFHIVNSVDREGKTVKSFTDPLLFQSLFRAQCEKAIATCGIEYR